MISNSGIPSATRKANMLQFPLPHMICQPRGIIFESKYTFPKTNTGWLILHSTFLEYSVPQSGIIFASNDTRIYLAKIAHRYREIQKSLSFLAHRAAQNRAHYVCTSMPGGGGEGGG